MEWGTVLAAAYVEYTVGERVLWGACLHPLDREGVADPVLSAVNRAERAAVAKATG
jgi:hypothetical protein